MTAKEQLQIILSQLRMKIPELAASIGVNRSTFYSIDRGLSKSFSTKTANILCEKYPVIDYLELINGRNPIKINSTLSHNSDSNSLTNKELALLSAENWKDIMEFDFFKNQVLLHTKSSLNNILIDVFQLLMLVKSDPKKYDDEFIKNELSEIINKIE